MECDVESVVKDVDNVISFAENTLTSFIDAVESDITSIIDIF